MLDLATHIVQTKAGHFDPAQFEDRYENALIDLLKKKQAGEKIEPAKERPTPQVVNLMDALRVGWPLLDDGRPSNKLSRATALGIPIVSERRFLEWIGKSACDNDQKTYSADQLADLSKMSRGMIQELAHLSLLDERDDRFGFRDLASARQIAKLLNDGVRLSEIIRAVSEVRKWLPDAGSAAMRLQTGTRSDVQVEQLGGRTDKYGQFVLSVDGVRDDPDDLFDRAHAADQTGDIVEAERLYRLLMKSDPTDASAPFNLGNMLRAANRTVEAEAALRAATRANPAFAEAWYNLADLLDDQGQSEAAVECLRKALLVAPDYVDATFNLALLLQRKGAYAEAADYWRRYLASDRASEWAARARRSLKFCEIQVNSLTSRPESQADSDRAA